MEISVVIPLYNKGELLLRAVRSVLKQRTACEIVIVDDGCTDAFDYEGKVGALSEEMGNTTASICFVHKANGGVSSARNAGWKKAKHEWIVFLDADDELCEGAFDVLDAMHRRYPDGLFLIGGCVWTIDGDDKAKTERRLGSGNAICRTRNPYWHVWMNHFYPGPRNMAVHRSLIDRYGGYDERMSFYEDLEFSMRLLKCRKVVFTGSPVGIYHQKAGGLSLSTHPIEREMAYYIPQYRCDSFFEKVLLYENIEMTLGGWTPEQPAWEHYRKMQKDHFPAICSKVHWFHQQMVRHGWIKA